MKRYHEESTHYHEKKDNKKKIFINGISHDMIYRYSDGITYTIQENFGNILSVTSVVNTDVNPFMIIVFENESSIESILNHDDLVFEYSKTSKKAKLRLFIPCLNRNVYVNVSHEAFVNLTNEFVNPTTQIQQPTHSAFNEIQTRQIQAIVESVINKAASSLFVDNIDLIQREQTNMKAVKKDLENIKHTILDQIECFEKKINKKMKLILDKEPGELR
jgi:hypothetical protein